MSSRTSFLAATVLSVLTLLIVVVNIMLVNSNRSLQQDINDRAQKIAASNTFGQIYQNMLQALALSAVKEKDQEIRKFLEQQGLQFSDEKPAADAGKTDKKEGK